MIYWRHNLLGVLLILHTSFDLLPCKTCQLQCEFLISYYLKKRKWALRMSLATYLIKCPSEVCRVQKPLPPYPSTVGAFPIWLSQYQHIILCYCHLWFLFHIISIIVHSFCFLKFISFFFLFFFCKYSIYFLPAKEI